jgi:hypothetical protein
MTREADKRSAEQVGWSLDLAALVSDVRAERVESLPADNVFSLALVLLASRFDEDELAQLLAVPEEVLDGAARYLHAQVQRELVVLALKEMGKKPKERKGNT